MFEEIYNGDFGCCECFDENILKNRNFIPFYIPFIKYTLKKLIKIFHNLSFGGGRL